MFEQLTDRAKKITDLAKREALRLGHGRVGTGHLLLGLFLEGTGVGANVLKGMGVDQEKVRAEVSRLVEPGSAAASGGEIPLTRSAVEALKCAADESRALHHNYVGTEHILLGLLDGDESVAARALSALGLGPGQIRDNVLRIVGAGEDEAAPPVCGLPMSDAECDKAREFFSPSQVDQMLRHTLQFCWLTLPKGRRTVDEVEAQMRRIFERAMRDLREDSRAFCEGDADEGRDGRR